MRALVAPGVIGPRGRMFWMQSFDTPPRVQSLRANNRLDRRMAAIKGRRHRSGVSQAVALQVRVQPAQRAKAETAAAALGISVAAYIDRLLAEEVLDESGRPLWWTQPVPADQEELPLKSA